MTRVRAKVCGITSSVDAELVIKAGADAIGMILYADSPRQINIDQAREIRAVVPAFVSLIGVVVNADKAKALGLYHEIGLDFLQLHGEESGAFASSLELPYIRAIRARSGQQVASQMSEHAAAAAFLLDPFVEGIHGGTGETLDARLWPTESSKPLILAGGLSPINLSDRINELQPYAVDLNSGLEHSPGKKSPTKIKQTFSLLAELNRT